MIFKCRNCGGNVIYSPEKRKMFCPFCESEESGERQDGPKEQGNSEEQGSPEESSILCPNCGGEVKLGKHTSASKCPYCDNYLIVDSRVQGEYEPKLLIPFRLGKEKCKEAVREKFKKNLFAPTDFLSEVRLNSMQGSYVPFWFYDYDTACDFLGEGTRVRSWTSGNMQYTETSYYDVSRSLDIQFRNIPVDASVEMPDEVMDLLEPYDYGELMEFKPEYLSGFFAEKYNMTSDLVESRAREKMREDAGELLKESCAGYANVRAIKNNIETRDEACRYGLLPVWKYIYKYKAQTYPFYINGQNGKMIGSAPVSKAKVLAYAGTLWAVLTAILCLLQGIIIL